MAHAPTWIFIDSVDQAGNRTDAIADHMAGDSLGHGDQLAIDHQHAMVQTGQERLH